MALSGANNEEKIWNYLLEKIGNAYGIAGMMGNLKGESGCEPCSAEMLLIQRYDEDKSKYPNISYLKGWKRPVNNPSNREYNNKRYAKFVDNGTITKEEFIHPRSYTGKKYQYGWAIHQITSPNRKEAFYEFAKTKGKSISNLSIQLQFLVKELKNDYPAVWKVLKNAKSVKEASDIVLTKFEIPADCSSSMKNLRASYGQAYYDKYAKKSSSSTNNSSSTTSNNVQNNTSNKITKIESAIKWMENLANDDSHGYCQEHRWGTDGDYDCSSAVITAWEQAGVPLKSNGATYTGNLYSVATKLGFKDVTSSVNLSTGSGLVRGDILLNHLNHVAMYCGNGKEVEASINEHGGITGGQPGDQTGKEILIKNYRNYPWNCILRYGNSTATTSSSSTKTSTGSHTVVADSLNVRTWAGMNYPTCSFSPLKYGDKVNIEYSIDGTDGSGKWYFIEYNGLKGFVLAEWIE